jgi:hypothetical protein
MKLTTKQIDELEKLHNAATPGPWVDDGGGDIGQHWEAGGADVLTADCGPCGMAGCSGAHVVIRDEDLAAIIAAHNTIPALIADARRRDEEIEGVTRDRDEWHSAATATSPAALRAEVIASRAEITALKAEVEEAGAVASGARDVLQAFYSMQREIDEMKGKAK